MLERAAGKFAEEVWRVLGNRSKAILTIACVVSAVLFIAIGRWFGVPHEPGYEMSIMLQPSPGADVLLIAVTLFAATAASTAIAGSVRFDAGLFGASVGLAALSGRGGPMRYVTQAAGGRAVFLAMAVEVVAVGAMLGLCWFGLWLLYRRGRLVGDAMRDGLEDQHHPIGERVLALAAQAVATAAMVLVLARVDDKKQVLAAVCIASFAATLLAFAVSPVRPSVWYWAGPIVVGVVGYLAAFLTWGSTDLVTWKSGTGGPFLAGLARPLPLDYASLGTAGAILGYWTSRQWQRAKELETEAAHATSTPLP